eukprot:6397048-Alexandrium_andersonii.AAC.1
MEACVCGRDSQASGVGGGWRWPLDENASFAWANFPWARRGHPSGMGDPSESRGHPGIPGARCGRFAAGAASAAATASAAAAAVAMVVAGAAAAASRRKGWMGPLDPLSAGGGGACRGVLSKLSGSWLAGQAASMVEVFPRSR